MPALLFGAGFGDNNGLNPFTAEGWNEFASVDKNESQLPNSLIGHEIAFTTEVDNAYYTGPTTGTPEDIHAAIRDPANWTTSDAYQGVQSFSFNVICFAAGTLIATPDGDVAVEDLAQGDAVLTADGRTVPVRWVGRQRVAAAARTLVRIAAGALGGGVPHADLTVTADHGMILDGLVIHAGALVNHETIVFVPGAELPETVTVYHVETEAHDVILANGAASETLIDYAGRRAVDNFDEYLALCGPERIFPEMARPRITSARMLPEWLHARLGGVASGVRQAG